ncbi:calcium-binding protein [Nocardioides gansuensis]|nr:calcium-binding protein [Nocardioides gansuensis]
MSTPPPIEGHPMHRIALTSLALLAPVLVALPASAAAEICDGRAATIVVPLEMAYPSSSHHTKPVTGTPGDDVIVGTALADTIDGAGGNDVICGLESEDTLTGGDGDDRLLGGLDGRERDPNPASNSSLGDLLIPGPGDDFVDLGLDPAADAFTFRPDQVRYDDSATAVHVDLTPVNGLGRAVGQGTDTIVVVGRLAVVGSPYDDHIIGTPYGDVIMSDRGSDSISGEGGEDRIFPDIAGFDVMETVDPEDADHISPDTVDGGAGDDFIVSNWGPSDVAAGDGDDYVAVSTGEPWDSYGSADGSHIEGGAGDDTVFAELVRKLRVSGGGGDDEITHDVFVRGGRTITDGGRGDDRLAVGNGTKLAPSARITVDRRRSRIRIERTVASMRGYEHHRLSGPGLNWVYLGTNAKDDVSAPRNRSLRARTFAGRDRVEGTKGRDVLDLGRGVDRADGGRGRDTCIDAERAKSCEIRSR